MAKKKSKTKRKNFIFPADLAEWADSYAKDHNTTVTRLLVDYLTALQLQVESGHVDQI